MKRQKKREQDNHYCMTSHKQGNGTKTEHNQRRQDKTKHEMTTYKHKIGLKKN